MEVSTLKAVAGNGLNSLLLNSAKDQSSVREKHKPTNAG